MNRNILIIVVIIAAIIGSLVIYQNMQHAQDSKNNSWEQLTPWEESGEDVLIKPILDNEVLAISQAGLCLNRYDLREHSAQHDFTISLFCTREPTYEEAESIVNQIGEKISSELPQLSDRDFDFMFYPHDTEDITQGSYYLMLYWRGETPMPPIY